MIGKIERWGPIVLMLTSATSIGWGCEEHEGFQGLPTVKAAVIEWEHARGIPLTPQATEKLANAVCIAVNSIAAESGASVSDIDAASGDAIKQYLEDSSASTSPFLPLKARLEKPFVLHVNPSLVEPPLFVGVSVRYTQNVDILVAGGKPLGKPKVFLSEVGNLSISGFYRSKAVCKQLINVSEFGSNQFTC